MTDSRAKYHPIPSPEDGACRHPETRAGAESLIVSSECQTKWIHFLLGCAILLPWNALLNASPFFLTRLAGSPLYSTFSSSLSSVYTLTNLFCQFYCTITSKQSSPSRRVFASISTTTVLVISLCSSTFIRGTPSAFFSFALFNAAALAVTTAYLCTAVYAGAALFGLPFLQSVISGQAAVAVAVSAVQVVSAIVSLWGSTSAPATIHEVGENQVEDIAARIFFGISAIFLGTTLVAYAWLKKQPLYKLVTNTLEHSREAGSADELAGLVADDHGNHATGRNARVYHILKRNWMFMFSIAYVFGVTLSVYPAITTRVESVNPHIHPLLFTSVHFLIFNIGDLVGRYSCSFPLLVVWSAKKLLAMSLLRTVFIPLFLLCNVFRPATTNPVIDSDVLFMTILLAMGYTNGYVSTLAMLAVSSPEHNPKLQGRSEDVDVAATLGAAFVNVGLASGALSSFGTQAMIPG